jgi:uncharacterized protein YegL
MSIVLLFAAAAAFAADCDHLVAVPSVNNIVLVIDKSGSMREGPFGEAQRAVEDFIGSMRSDDRAAVIAFSDDVGVVQGFTSQKQTLRSAVRALEPGGQTRLYDAIARAGQLLIGQPGFKVIVYLTDGSDNRSTFSLRNIREMNIGEGVFVYGIGLGDVDHGSLRRLSAVTNGRYKNTGDYTRLAGLYGEVLSSHYRAVDEVYGSTGSFVVTSVPSGRQVRINGNPAGTTPLRIDNLPEEEHSVEVAFPLGLWECEAPSRAGYRTYITARESELPTDLWVESAPANAAVYLDGSYVGTTALQPSTRTANGIDYSNQLKIPSVPEGRHSLKLIAVPDFDFSPSQVFEFEFEMEEKPRYVNVKIFLQKAEWNDGAVSRGKNAPVNEDGSVNPDNIRKMIPDLDF